MGTLIRRLVVAIARWFTTVEPVACQRCDLRYPAGDLTRDGLCPSCDYGDDDWPKR